MTQAGIEPGRAERRRHPRLPVSLPVFIRGTDDSGKKFLEFATALNISAGGILLATRRSLPASAGILLEIPVAPLSLGDVATESVRSMKARMVRVDHRERCHLVGLRFLRPLGTGLS